MDDRRLMFLHLPKTAGSTLRRIIERQFGIDAVYAIGEPTSDSIDRLLELPRQRLDSLRAVVGHVPFGLHELLPWPVAYVTLIREPVDRIVSHFHFALRTPGSPLATEVEAAGRSLRRYVEEAPSGPYFNDGQTRLLGSPDARQAPPATETALERAKARLASAFSVVGLTERFDESLALLRGAFGWRRARYHREKVGWNRPPMDDIPQEDLRAVADRNRLDADLYAFAVERFAEAVAAAPAGRRGARLHPAARRHA